MGEPEEILIRKIAWIIGVTETTVKWDMAYFGIIERLVKAYEKLAEEKEVEIYGK